MALILCEFSFVGATSSDPLKIYKERLTELNEELGTSYAIVSDGSMSDEEVVEFYKSMSMSEFDDYIYSLNQLDIQSSDGEDEDVEFEVSEEEIETEDSEISTYASTQVQRYYYLGYEPNAFIYKWSIGRNSNNKKCYNYVTWSSCTGRDTGVYPSFDLIGTSNSYTHNYRRAHMSASYYKYLSATLMDTAIHTRKFVFRINGGDVYYTI